jgi:hypothetical protein
VLTRGEPHAILGAVDGLGPIVGTVSTQRPGEVLCIRWNEIGRDDGGSCWQLPDHLAKRRAHPSGHC